MSKVEPGSRRSPGGAVLMSKVEPGSRRSPGGAVLMGISTAGILYPTPVPLLPSLNFKRRKYTEREICAAEIAPSILVRSCPHLMRACQNSFFGKGDLKSLFGTAVETRSQASLCGNL